MKPKGILSIEERFQDQVFSGDQLAEIRELIDLKGIYPDQASLEADPDVLEDVEFLFSGWGSVPVDADFLARAPKFKAIFSATGTLRHIATEAFWERDDLLVTNAAHANAIPVAEYCLATILFSLKLGWRHIRTVRATRTWQWEPSVPGGFGSTVGLVSLGEIGRRTLELLQSFDLDICVFSTSLTEDAARKLGVRRLGLEDLFAQADVISLHTPALPSTEGMVNRELLGLMKTDATLINSARGAVVDQEALVDVLRARPDLTAVLDVTVPDPLNVDSPLYELDNAILTPHIAGSMYGETQRLAQYAIDSCREYLEGKRPRWTVTREQFGRMA